MRTREEITEIVEDGNIHNVHVVLAELLLDIRDIVLRPYKAQELLEDSRRDHEREMRINKEKDLLGKMVADAFAHAKPEEFEDGRRSQFAEELENMLRDHDFDAVYTIFLYIESGDRQPYVVSEALRTLGHYVHDKKLSVSREYTRQHAEILLFHKETVVRSGAEICISFINDLRSIPALEKAAENEKSELLKKSILHLVDYLKKEKP